MKQPASTNPERIWVIQQYLNGTLPEDLRQQVEERRKLDAGFDQQVLTLGLLDLYAENERHTRSFYEETDKITIASVHKRPVYNTTKKLDFLPRIIKLYPELFIGLAALLLIVFTWTITMQTTPPTEQLAVDDSELPGAGMGSTKQNVAVMRYERVPGLAGLWQLNEQYKWPGDTLFLYGKVLQKMPLDSLQVFATDSASQYHIQVGQRRFRIQKGQSENQPLMPDETP